MSKLIRQLPSGDKLYLYDKSLVLFFKDNRKVLSTSVFNGGYHEDYVAVFNNDGKQGSGMPCEMLDSTYVGHMHKLCERLALDSNKVTGMTTAASMENAFIAEESYKNLVVTAIITAGVETNGGRVGDPTNYFHPTVKPGRPGTINIILCINCDLPPGTLTRALVTCTEGKTAALQELIVSSNYSSGIATGSGTDQTIIIANPNSDLYLEGAGKHDKLGELIGKVIIKGVKGALAKQSNLTPHKQHDTLRRWKRYGLTPNFLWQAYQQQYPELLKPVFLLNLEKISQEPMMLTYTSLYIHLIDQYLWELISLEELHLAGLKILELIAQHFNLKFTMSSDKTIKDWTIMKTYWCNLCLEIIANSK